MEQYFGFYSNTFPMGKWTHLKVECGVLRLRFDWQQVDGIMFELVQTC